LFTERAFSDQIGDEIENLWGERADNDRSELSIEFCDGYETSSNERDRDGDVEFSLTLAGKAQTTHRVFGIDEPLFNLLVHFTRRLT
jgi:uncharacterized Zn finger protein